jgi:hypothetical protein
MKFNSAFKGLTKVLLLSDVACNFIENKASQTRSL